jgi:uncharacterized membrane protein
MTEMFITAAALMLLAAWAYSFSGLRSVPGPARVPQSPLDEAERIVTARYAHGTITPDEYERMLSILRR